jgi:hypothetical protein
MHQLFQIILSLFPYYFDFPIDKLPNYFLESVYLLNKGRYYDINVIDKEKRIDEIRNFFKSELHGWSYYQTFVTYVPGYMLKSDNMEIDYKCSFITVNYRERGHWIVIRKKISSPFPALIDVDNHRCSKHKNK